MLFRSYAQVAHPGPVIHGGTSEFDSAARANQRARGAKKKQRSQTTSAAKVAEGAREASPPKPPTLPSAARRFFAPRLAPAPHPSAQEIMARFPDIAASLLREANCTLPRALKTVVNDRGSVTLIVSDTSVPAASFAPYFDALTKKLNQSYPIGDNPWLPLRLAPTSVQLAIHSLPVPFMPRDDADLMPQLSESILNSKDVTILSARFLNPDRTA